MELITSLKFEPQEINDIITALEIALKEENQHELSTEQLERYKKLHTSLNSFSIKTNEGISTKKKH